jgi:hypothetical protein
MLACYDPITAFAKLGPIMLTAFFFSDSTVLQIKQNQEAIYMFIPLLYMGMVPNQHLIGSLGNIRSEI